ncbi:hypothetical protein D8B45_02950, partial [Candidatus Gracilibacteria bacterium]
FRREVRKIFMLKKFFKIGIFPLVFILIFGLVLRFMNGRGNLGLIFFEESSYFSLEVALSVLGELF